MNKNLRRSWTLTLAAGVVMASALPSLAQGDGDFQRQQAEQGLGDASRRMPDRNTPNQPGDNLSRCGQPRDWGCNNAGRQNVPNSGNRVAGNAHWKRGDRLPPELLHRNAVVSDWRSRKLAAPSRGYQWVQVNGDYVQVQPGSGLIGQVVLGRH